MTKDTVSPVLVLNLLSDHLGDLLDSDASDSAQPSDDLLMLLKEDFGEDEFVWTDTHLFYRCDVLNDLLDDVEVVRSDLMQFLSLGERESGRLGRLRDRRVSLILTKVLFPVGKVARIKVQLVFPAVTKLFRLHLTELVTVKGLIGELGSISELIESTQKLSSFVSSLNSSSFGFLRGFSVVRRRSGTCNDIQIDEFVTLNELEVAIGKYHRG